MSNSTSMPSASKKPSSWATKSFRPMPLGATRTLRMTPPIGIAECEFQPAGLPASMLRKIKKLEVVRQPDAQVVVRLFLGDRARRGVAVQTAKMRAGEHYPTAAQVVSSLDAVGGVEQAAIAGGVVGADPIVGCPGTLRIKADPQAVAAVHAHRAAQVGLRAQIAIEMLAGAQQHVDRRRADRGAPLEMHTERRARVDVRAVVAADVGKLHAGVQSACDLPAGAPFQRALRGAREERAAVIAHYRNQLELLLARAVVLRQRAHAQAEQGVIILRQSNAGNGEQHGE